MKLLLALILLLAACEGKHSPNSSQTEKQSSTQPSSSTTDMTMTEEFMKLLNDHRISIGIRPLILDLDMTEIAQTHSDNMAQKIVAFGHDGFSSRCSEARAALGGGNLCAENVAMGQKTAQSVFNAWMNSSGHKANMEQSRVTHTGFGIAKSSSGTIYWTQLFLER